MSTLTTLVLHCLAAEPPVHPRYRAVCDCRLSWRTHTHSSCCVLTQAHAPGATFIRELIYRFPDQRALAKTLQDIQKLKKRANTIAKEEAEKKTIKKQEKLILDTSGKQPRLQNVFIRPFLSGRNQLGVLEAHKNGFRFTAKGNTVGTPFNSIPLTVGAQRERERERERLQLTNLAGAAEILYKNIKHAVFHATVKEIFVLVHFHLKDAIMIGKKKATDVQFCAEAIEASQRLGTTELHHLHSGAPAT